MSIGAIIQARLDSTRLPRKVLLNLNKKTVLFHVLKRVSQIKKLTKIVVAIPKNNKSSILKKEIEKYKSKIFFPIFIYEGSEHNVFERTLFAARSNNIKTIIRITSDCPFIDYEVSSKLLKNFLLKKLDYARFCEKYGYPLGFETEIFSLKILEKLKKVKLTKFEKEHVTPYIWKNEKSFKSLVFKPKKNFKNLRLVIDTKEDYKLAKKLYSQLRDNFCYKDIITLYEQNPHIFFINSMIKQKATIGKNEKK